MMEEDQKHKSRDGFLSTLDSAVGKVDDAFGSTAKKTSEKFAETFSGSFSENTEHAKQSAMKLFDKVKDAIENAYDEANDRISTHLYEETAIEQLARSLDEGQCPQLFSDLVEDALGFDALSTDTEIKVMVRDADSLFVAMPSKSIAVRVESFDEDTGEQSPEFRRYLAHTLGSLVQPVGASKQEVYPGTCLYCTVYVDNFSYGDKAPEETGSISDDGFASRLSEPATLRTLYALHCTSAAHVSQKKDSPFDPSELEHIISALERKVKGLCAEEISDADHNMLYRALKELQDISTEAATSEEETVLVGESLNSAVFREFVGSMANVGTFYYGPAVFDLAYIAKATGLVGDTHGLFELLYHYRLGSKTNDAVRNEEMIRMIDPIAESLGDIERIERRVRAA